MADQSEVLRKAVLERFTHTAESPEQERTFPVGLAKGCCL
jgi:hypothetical protein